ncbi:PRD domain-containing protein [Clostridium sp. SM-530-WT-3G]|uniref:BglG family transcription antiterminator n=1 Tax=Clostridium sp. SM-530-WT-3G TaxID=2725303 RepID=UPI00145ED0B9|nr:PRD domain-containing protein [Clostridium sp. SM-530-WT-3G]NME83929.1 PRD domain-containing protein [Clostridium sp. SM-530-WT-3G]
MSTILNKDAVLLKVFNNNIILVGSDKSEKILFAKGIGFGKKQGCVIPKGTEIDKVFTIENEQNISDFKNLVELVDKEFFAVCEEAICEVSSKINSELNERIHIGLVDHLFFAVKRLKNNEEIENPFLIETQTLYAKEFELSKIVAEKIEKYEGIKIPDGEIGFITLHIHTALNDGKISNTMKNTYLSTSIVEYVEKELGKKIDKTSLDYARFCTHIKFAIQRITNKVSNKNDLIKVIKKTYKESYKISQGISEIISDELGIEVTEDETAFLAIHVERFRINTK